MISGSLSVLSSFASKSSHSFLSPLLSHCGDKIYIKQIQLIIFFILPPQPSEIPLLGISLLQCTSTVPPPHSLKQTEQDLLFLVLRWFEWLGFGKISDMVSMMGIWFFDVVFGFVVLLVEQVAEVLCGKTNDVGWVFFDDSL